MREIDQEIALYFLAKYSYMLVYLHICAGNAFPTPVYKPSPIFSH